MQFFRKSILVGLLAFSLAAATLAQDDVSITDGRVNQNQLLGGIGIFCEDQNGVVSGNYTNGGISVWSAEGDKYLFASATDIAAAQELFPLVNVTDGTTLSSDLAQQGAEGNTTGNTQSSNSTNLQGRSGTFETLRIGSQTTGLLATAQTNRGPYNLYAAGGENFYLIGLDEYGRQFLYRWTGCTNANSEVLSFGFPLFAAGTTTRANATVTPRASATAVATTDATVTATPEATATVTSGG